MSYSAKTKLLRAFIVLLTVLSISSAIAEGLPNPYKLDLRKASKEQEHGALAYASSQRVTIAIYSGSEDAWKVVKDVGKKLAAQRIRVNIAWIADNDDNIQTARVLIYANSQAHESIILSTKVGLLNYDAMVNNGYVDSIFASALKIHRNYFRNFD